MSGLRCPVPSRRRDDRAGATPCLSTTLPFARLRGHLLDLPALLPGSELLPPRVPADSTAVSAPAGQPPSPAKSRGTAGPSRPPARLPPAPRHGSRDGSMSTPGFWLAQGVLLRPTSGREESRCDEMESCSPGSSPPAPAVRVVWPGRRSGAAGRPRMSRDATGDAGGDPAPVLR